MNIRPISSTFCRIQVEDRIVNMSFKVIIHGLCRTGHDQCRVGIPYKSSIGHLYKPVVENRSTHICGLIVPKKRTDDMKSNFTKIKYGTSVGGTIFRK